MNAGIACFSAFFLGISLGLLNSNLPKVALVPPPKSKRKRKKKKQTKIEEQKENNTIQIPVNNKEDLEVLSEIFQDDLTITHKPNQKETKFKIFLYPTIKDAEINCSLYLSVIFPQKYPQVNPIFELQDPVGISASIFVALKEKLIEKVAQFIALKKSLVFECCTWLKEELIKINPTPPPSLSITISDIKENDSYEDSGLEFHNEIQQEYINRNRQIDQPMLLNSVNNIKDIQNELAATDYKVPEHIKGFDYKSYFEEKEVIGKGGGGIVYKVVNKIDECFYAVKVINLKGEKASDINNIMKEVLVLSRLQHQYIVRYHNAWFEEESDDDSEEEDSEELSESEESSDLSSHSRKSWVVAFQRSRGSLDPFMWENEAKKKVCKLYIQMEYCALNSLQESLNSRLPTPEEAWKMLKEILQGLSYIHSRNTIHRDMKPSNIFLGAQGEVKLGDFGLAATSANKEISEDCTVGTPLYLSPEQEKGKYDQKSDIFSLGIIFFEMWRRFSSYMQKVDEIKKLTKMHVLPADFEPPEQVKAIILWLTETDPDKRPTAEELLQSSLLPHLIERKNFEEVLRVAIRPNTVENEWLYQGVFKQENLPLIEFTYNTTSSINTPSINRRKMKIDSMLNTSVSLKFYENFMNAGAVEIKCPLLYPYYKNLSINTQDRNGTCRLFQIENSSSCSILIERSGIMVQLPTNALVPWARKVAKREFGGIIKRFAIQTVYHSAGKREHPKEFKEASLDFCYETSLYHPVLRYWIQAEMLRIAFNTISDVFVEQKGVVEVHINDSRILDALLDYSEVKHELRPKVLKIFANLYRLNSKSLKQKLGELGLSFTICEKLESFFKIKGKLVDIKEHLKKQSIYRDKILQQILNEDLVYMEKCCSYYGLKNIIFDFSVIDEDLLYYSGFLCRFIYKDYGAGGKKNRCEISIVATGGCYDNLIEHYTMPGKLNGGKSSNVSGIGVTIYFDEIVSLLIQSGAYSWLYGPSVFVSNAITIQNNEFDDLTKMKIKIVKHIWKNRISAVYNYNDLSKEDIDEFCKRYKIRFWIHLENKNKKKEPEKIEGPMRKDSEKKEFDKKEAEIAHEIKITLRDNAKIGKGKAIEELSKKELVETIKEKLMRGPIPLAFKTKSYEISDDEPSKY